jgi:hypothetical protein
MSSYFCDLAGVTLSSSLEPDAFALDELAKTILKSSLSSQSRLDRWQPGEDRGAGGSAVHERNRSSPFDESVQSYEGSSLISTAKTFAAMALSKRPQIPNMYPHHMASSGGADRQATKRASTRSEPRGRQRKVALGTQRPSIFGTLRRPRGRSPGAQRGQRADTREGRGGAESTNGLWARRMLDQEAYLRKSECAPTSRSAFKSFASDDSSCSLSSSENSRRPRALLQQRRAKSARMTSPQPPSPVALHARLVTRPASSIAALRSSSPGLHREPNPLAASDLSSTSHSANPKSLGIRRRGQLHKIDSIETQHSEHDVTVARMNRRRAASATPHCYTQLLGAHLQQQQHQQHQVPLTSSRALSDEELALFHERARSTAKHTRSIQQLHLRAQSAPPCPRSGATPSPSRSPLSVRSPDAGGGAIGATVLAATAALTRKRVATFRRKAPPPQSRRGGVSDAGERGRGSSSTEQIANCGGDVPRVQKYSAFSRQARAAIEQHEAFVRQVRVESGAQVVHVHRLRASAGGGEGGAGGSETDCDAGAGARAGEGGQVMEDEVRKNGRGNVFACRCACCATFSVRG